MALPFELFVGLRYVRARRGNRFVSFISMTSMLGIALGVAALIVVMSVMNGFQHELRTRILGVASHLQVSGYDLSLSDWQAVAERVKAYPGVEATAPYVNAQGMLTTGEVARGAMVRGIDPALEPRVADFLRLMKVGELSDLTAGRFGIVLGVDLARSMGLGVGDRVTLIAPQGNVTPVGVAPRLRAFEVVGVFEAGMYEFDAGLALLHLSDAQLLYRLGEAVSGVRLRLTDLFDAPRLSRQINDELGRSGLQASDWTRSHANFFRAVQIEKRVMFVILTLIVAVAAFNIVSTLVMAVSDKQSDIAILRTLGASPLSMQWVFMVQGAVIGVAGLLLGLGAGVLLALNIDVVVPAIERTFGIQFLAKDVYYISDLPSRLEWGDVGWIAAISLLLTLVATIYPSRRAARVHPAEALRYE